MPEFWRFTIVESWLSAPLIFNLMEDFLGACRGRLTSSMMCKRGSGWFWIGCREITVGQFEDLFTLIVVIVDCEEEKEVLVSRREGGGEGGGETREEGAGTGGGGGAWLGLERGAGRFPAGSSSSFT